MQRSFHGHRLKLIYCMRVGHVVNQAVTIVVTPAKPRCCIQLLLDSWFDGSLFLNFEQAQVLTFT